MRQTPQCTPEEHNAAAEYHHRHKGDPQYHSDHAAARRSLMWADRSMCAAELETRATLAVKDKREGQK